MYRKIKKVTKKLLRKPLALLGLLPLCKKLRDTVREKIHQIILKYMQVKSFIKTFFKAIMKAVINKMKAGYQRIKLWLYTQLTLLKMRNKQIVLIFDHNWGGGSNFYRSEFIAKKHALNQACLLVCPRMISHQVFYELSYSSTHKAYVIHLEALSEVEKIIKRLRIKQIFFNNCVSYPDPLQITQLLIKVKNSYKINLILALHDFFMICPSYALMDYTNKFCGIPSAETCHACFKQNKNLAYQSEALTIVQWRKAWNQCFLLADEIKCFSHSSKKVLLQTYPDIDLKKLIVEPHIVNYIPTDRTELIDAQAPLNIAIVGNIGIAHKGIFIVKEILKKIKQELLNIKITIIGELHEFPSDDIVTVTGGYNRNDLPEIIKKSGANVFFVPSICSETFSYVTHELIQLKLPLAVFNIGAQAEAVASYSKGCIIPEIDASVALKNLINFHQRLKNSE